MPGGLGCDTELSVRGGAGLSVSPAEVVDPDGLADSFLVTLAPTGPSAAAASPSTFLVVVADSNIPGGAASTAPLRVTSTAAAGTAAADASDDRGSCSGVRVTAGVLLEGAGGSLHGLR